MRPQPSPWRGANAALLASCLALGGCISSPQPPANPEPASSPGGYAPDTGPDPVLPAPRTPLLPVVEIAPAVGWPEGAAPTPAPGFSVTAFARDLEHPRTVLVLPNGDVLVAEANRPPPPEPPEGLRARAMAAVMERAGAGVPSADRITLLRDADGDGVAEQRHVFLSGLRSPFGMALAGDTLYVANADALVAVPYAPGATSIAARPRKVADLPAGRNHHWTKSLAASADGRRLYVGVGSNSNIAEHGMDEEAGRAAVLEVDPASGSVRVLASGLRNPTALAFQPADQALWAVVNERDELGDGLVPDYLVQVREGAFYGWPWSYFGQHVDARVQPQAPAMVARAVVPDYALGAHVAPLGLAFHPGHGVAARFRHGAFIGLHGSWNRQPKVGYRVVFVPFRDGRPAGPMAPVLDGFVDARGQARGRPTGVAIDHRGGVLVADDVGNAVWRVAPVGGG